MYVFKYVYMRVTKTLTTRQRRCLQATMTAVGGQTQYLIRFGHVPQLGLDAKADRVIYCQMQGDLVSALKCLPIIFMYMQYLINKLHNRKKG